MSLFQLFAHGDAFDPDIYIATSLLTFDGVWRRGQSGRGHPQSSGVYKLLGDGTTLSDEEQERIAIEYLSANREALMALARRPDVTTFILGLQHNVQLDDSVTGFCMGPSASLMKCCLDVGVLPVFYVSIGRSRDAEEMADA